MGRVNLLRSYVLVMSMCVCGTRVRRRARAYAVTRVNPGRAGREAPDRRVAAAYGDDHQQIWGLKMLKNGVSYHA
jgi:hypothetical protein